MAICGVPHCGKEVETHRYLRAEPMEVRKLPHNRTQLVAIGPHVCGFYCLSHPAAEIAEAIEAQWPPSETIPVRLLWSPAPRVILAHQTGGLAVVQERKSRDGHHGVRTALVTHPGFLLGTIDAILPPGTRWFLPGSGVQTVDEAADILTRLFGDDDEASEIIRDKIAKLGTGGPNG